MCVIFLDKNNIANDENTRLMFVPEPLFIDYANKYMAEIQPFLDNAESRPQCSECPWKHELSSDQNVSQTMVAFKQNLIDNPDYQFGCHKTVTDKGVCKNYSKPFLCAGYEEWKKDQQ